ncbi:hypothetical protein NSTC745_04313 [Nostoc sp. DSM 114161]|jgi:site-specific recombinase XerD|uniref:tyrosine-type recombinase/integrase n=1 Tax=Nostoc sp. DSM 114161 TaxID=3440143 RepID=UPI00404647C7
MGRSYRASTNGLQKAEAAFKLKGWTQEYLAGGVGCTRQTVIKFFDRRPVAKHLFKVPIHAHMLRHGTGYYLPNRGIDTRTIQSYLGHKNIQHTVRYTELASTKFQGLWDD